MLENSLASVEALALAVESLQQVATLSYAVTDE
jgi:hypothetical protein